MFNLKDLLETNRKLFYEGNSIWLEDSQGNKLPPYLPSPKLVDAVNLSIFLENRPLLLKGEPGCGKTRLAEAVARELGLDYYPWYIKSTTKAKDGLYTYDAVARLYDVQLVSVDKQSESQVKDLNNLNQYIRKGPLGHAFENEKRTVVLIDEDDFLLGFTGSLQEAREIKEKLKLFLAEKLQLELSPEKTLITHAKNEAANFLGYDILVQHSDNKHTNGRRSINGNVALRIPASFIEEKCALYMKNGKPIHRPELINDDNFTIVNIYQSEYRGYVQYYSLAQNIAWLQKLQWVMGSSLMKTLAYKHKTSVAKISAKYYKTVKLPHGLRKCVEITVPRDGKKPLVARFGGIQLKRNLKTTIEDLPTKRKPPFRNELIKRLLADECEICGATGNIEVHHIRALKDLKIKGKKDLPLWKQVMSARRRKTLMVCPQCHDAIHAGKPTGKRIY